MIKPEGGGKSLDAFGLRPVARGVHIVDHAVFDPSYLLLRAAIAAATAEASATASPVGRPRYFEVHGIGVDVDALIE